MTDTDAGPYRCPTPCDPDCEISAHGCHETHDVPSHREHDPTDCAMRTLEGNILWLIDAGWFLQLGSCGVPDGQPPMWFAALRKPGRQVDVTFTGVSVAEAAGKAADWAREAEASPAAATGCRGFQWIGQPFASCDGCGKPAWEHDGMLGFRDADGHEGDDPVIPWKPGEAEAIKRKRGAVTTPAEVVHACPPDGSTVTPCCDQSPFDLPRTDRITEDPALVNCGGKGAAP